jgi:GTPase SAR1 family protein
VSTDAGIRPITQPGQTDRVDALSRRARELADVVGVPFPESEVRQERPTALFVGEPGRGKTSLINALLGEPLLPVGDDSLPCYVVIRHGATGAYIHRLGENETVELQRQELAGWFRAGGADEIAWVEIRSEAPILEGLDLIDTPAKAAANVGDASATVHALGDADVLVFVADARSALTAPELRYLEEVSSASVATLLVLTRRDLFPAWQQIAADNEALLAQYGSDPTRVRIRAVSAHLAAEAARRGREGNPRAAVLEERSGISALRTELKTLAAAEVLSLRLEREVIVADAVLGKLIEIETRQLVPDDEAGRNQALAEVEAQLDSFQRTVADYAPRVGDEFTRIELGLRRSFMLHVQELGREWATRIERMSPKELEGLPADLERDIAKLFGHLQQELRLELAGAISRLEGALGIAGVMVTPDARLSVAGGRRPVDGHGRRAADPQLDRADRLLQAAGVVVGAGGPLVVVDLVSKALGLALGTFVGPIGLVAGIAFGSLKLVHQRRSKDFSTSRRIAQDVVRDALDNLRADVPPSLSLRLLDVRRVVESDVRHLIQLRGDELRRHRDELRRRAADDHAERAERLASAQRRIRSLEGGRRTAAALLEELEANRAAQ